jgi:rfaE bifunctional protein kinase chain/domain
VTTLDIERLDDILQRMAHGRVLVVGDLMADEYVTGEVSRISREAPVLILRHCEARIFPGGAANAAANIASFGARVEMAGVVGADPMATRLQEVLLARGVGLAFTCADPNRPTTTKTRISASSQQTVTQQIVRIDQEVQTPLPEPVAAELLTRIETQLDGFDAVLLSDYGNGVLSHAVIDRLMIAAIARGIPVTVDSQGDLARFQGARILTPNQPEAEAVAGFPIVDTDSLRRAGEALLTIADADAVLITRGASGMALFERAGSFCEIPAFNRSDVFDVTGAGDTVVGTLTLALAVGATTTEAMWMANLAASIVVRRFGTSVTNRDEMLQAAAGLTPMDDRLGIRRA